MAWHLYTYSIFIFRIGFQAAEGHHAYSGTSPSLGCISEIAKPIENKAFIVFIFCQASHFFRGFLKNILINSLDLHHIGLLVKELYS